MEQQFKRLELCQNANTLDEKLDHGGEKKREKQEREGHNLILYFSFIKIKIEYSNVELFVQYNNT